MLLIVFINAGDNNSMFNPLRAGVGNVSGHDLWPEYIGWTWYVDPTVGLSPLLEFSSLIKINIFLRFILGRKILLKELFHLTNNITF